jgi:hypothetical protein
MRPIALFLLATVAVISPAQAQEGGPHELPGIIVGHDKNKDGDNTVAPEPPAPAPAPKFPAAETASQVAQAARVRRERAPAKKPILPRR